MKKASILLFVVALTVLALALSSCSLGDNSGLKYEPNEDGQSYSVSGLSESFKEAELVIPSEYKGKPVTGIGAKAFSNCSNVKSIVIPDSVVSIDEDAIYYCPDLESITVSDGNPNFCSADGILYDKPVSKMIHVPEKLGGNVTIPDGVTSIDSNMFRVRADLTSVTIGSGVTNIGSSAFDGCAGLTSVVLGNGVESIGDHAFSGCTGLTSITIGSGLTSIGNEAFYNCGNLSDLYITDIAKWCGISFEGSSSNPSAQNVYLNGTLVTDLVIPDGVTSIGNKAFSYWKGLTSVTIPDSVTRIGNYAFDSCIGLTTITLGNGVTGIGEYAFKSCGNLISVTIGNGVTKIGKLVFQYSDDLTSITYNGTKSQWGAIGKEYNWNGSTGSYTIHCTDGDITK